MSKLAEACRVEYVSKQAMREQIDSMGEEIASDINQLELTVKNHEDCFGKVQ